MNILANMQNIFGLR